MEKAAGFIYQFSLKAVKWLSAFLVLILFISGFLWTCYAEDMNTQLVLTRGDRMPASLLGLAATLSILYLLLKYISKSPVKHNRLLLCIVLLWYLTAGLLLVLFSKTVPAADSMSVYAAASQLAAGDTSVISPTDSYLSYYPQQMGLVFYYELLIRLWNLLPTTLPAYHFLKCVNVIWSLILVLFQYRIVQLLFGDSRTDTVFLMLSIGNLPLIMYTSFVYGEVPSFALFCVGLWAVLNLLSLPLGKTFSLYSTVSILSFAGAVLLRKNTLIPVIAAILVAVLQAVRHRRFRFLGLAAAYTAAALIALPLVTGFYEYRAGNTLRNGVTAMSYFAMGMQESSRADGWYNGFNFDTYQEAGMDAGIANEISRQAIRERLSYFREHPAYAARFYLNKFRSQWCDGTYASRQATLATFGGRTTFFQKLYEGEYSKYYIGFCNLFQNLLYLGSLIFCLGSLRKKEDPSARKGLPVYLCLIGVIGGFLFHMIWEANSRYIFPYGLLLLPYSAVGISNLFPVSFCRCKPCSDDTQSPSCPLP